MKVPLMQYFDDFACPGLLEDERLLGDLLELLEGILGTAGEHNLSDLPSRLKVEWAHHPIRGVLPRRVYALVKRAIRGMRSEQPRADSAAGHR
ncbi:hypothetical protein DIPPA_30743 [Diplonema papillatum]|nr:hypothetical protein DIPPA_30743 [Diplonema papillatum]